MWHNTWCATKLQTGYYIPFFSWNSVLFPQGKFLSIRNDTSLVITCWKEVENSTFSAPLKFLLQFRILLKSNWWNIFFFHLLLNIATNSLLSCQNVNWSDTGLQEIFTGSPVILCACATVLWWTFLAYSDLSALSYLIFAFTFRWCSFFP